MFIFLIVAVNCGMTLIRESLPNDTEQFHITISGITKTGKCTMTVKAAQVDLDFTIPVANTFGINFISGGGTYTVVQMDQAQTQLTLDSCPTSTEFIIGPFQVVHLLAVAVVQVRFNTATTQSFRSNLNYFSYTSTNVQITTNSEFTSDKDAVLQLQYTPVQSLTGVEIVNIILPFRDQFRTTPSLPYFPASLLNCIIYKDNILVSGVSCFFNNNVVTIPNLVGSSTFVFKFNNFQNPQSVAPITIEFQLTQFFTSTYYIIESLSGITLNTPTPSQIIYPGIYLSDKSIGSLCDIQFMIQYTDFLYLGTQMTITFPNNFLVSPFTITMNSNLRQDFTYTINGAIIIIDNFLLTDGQQSLLKFVISTTNPKIMQNYNGLQIQFSNNGDQIAYSGLQNLYLQPQNFKTFAMTNQNQKLTESTQYCYNFELNNPIDTHSFIQIIFYSPVTFESSLSLINILNLDPGATLTRNGQILTINNAFPNTQFNQQISFCLNGVFNPYFIDSINQNYDFSIQLNSFPQVVNKNSQFIDLLAGDINVISIIQSNDMTNLQGNNITIVMKTHSGLVQGDFLIVTFDSNQYDFEIVYLNNNYITCYVQSQTSRCTILDNKIQITSSVTIQRENTFTIIIQKFITNRSVNKPNPINIATKHQQFQIDSTNQPSYLSVSQPNKFKRVTYSINDGLDIQFQYLYNILSTDVTYIDLPSTIDCSKCQCISDNCVIANNVITITSVALDNNLQTFSIINQPLDIIPSYSIRVEDQQGFLIYQDKTPDEYRLYKFELFTLIPFNTTVGLSNIYTLSFKPNVQINAMDSIILDLTKDFGIQSITCNNVKCTFNNTKIQLQFNVPINPHEMISLQLDSIINPMSQVSYYYYSLSHFDTTNVLIQQSIMKSQQFTCLFENCLQCQTTYCQKCNYPYLEVEGNCLLSCPKNYIIIDSSCKQCQAGKHCSICSTLNLQRCVECMIGYSSIDGQCIKIDYYNFTSDNTTNTSLPNNTTVIEIPKPVLNSEPISHSIGLLNYFQFGVFGLLVLYKLMKKETQLFFTFSIFLGFSVPVFRIFSLISFVNDGLLLFANYSVLLIGMSAFQSLYFQFLIQTPLYLDADYKDQLKMKNNFYLLNILFQYLDFRIMCCLRSQLFKSNFYNYRFESHEIIRDAVLNNYKKLITVVNPFNFAFLLTAVLVTVANNYQFEFLIFTSVEWLADIVVLWQMKQF